MGNRLVLSMKKNGKDLVTGYFHWSATSIESAEILNDVLCFLDSSDEEVVKRYINSLYSVGAGLSKEAIALIKEKDIEVEIIDCVDRNYGIIEVTEEEMEKSKNYAEILITINYQDNTDDFTIDCSEILFEDEISKEEAQESNYNIIDIDFKLKKMNISEAIDFANILRDSFVCDVYAIQDKIYKEIQ